MTDWRHRRCRQEEIEEVLVGVQNVSRLGVIGPEPGPFDSPDHPMNFGTHGYQWLPFLMQIPVEGYLRLSCNP